MLLLLQGFTNSAPHNAFQQHLHSDGQGEVQPLAGPDFEHHPSHRPPNALPASAEGMHGSCPACREGAEAAAVAGRQHERAAAPAAQPMAAGLRSGRRSMVCAVEASRWRTSCA